MLLMGEGCCPNYARMYSSAGDIFSPWAGATSTYGAAISVDNTGQHVLIASSLFDANLSLVADYDPPHFDLAYDRVNSTTPTVISAAGDIAYMSIRTPHTTSFVSRTEGCSRRFSCRRPRRGFFCRWRRNAPVDRRKARRCHFPALTSCDACDIPPR